MTEAGEAGTPPDEDEFEVVLFGPGYGESIVPAYRFRRLGDR